MGNELQRWADRAMFEAAPMQGETDNGIAPQVYLLWMTPDPLGAVAAMCRMYEGKPTYSLGDLKPGEREHYFEQVQKTHLQAPLEAVKLHFFIEGVDRAFTHQMVRQRTAVYAQESLRFAVKSNLASEVVVPPHIIHADQPVQDCFNDVLMAIEKAYNALINAGIPAEDARAILPHCVATRLNYVTDLKALGEHAGNRLCTQAQFHWRLVFARMIKAIREFDFNYAAGPHPGIRITQSNLFKPKCYQLGHCPFKADFDRACSIRDRVDAFHANGVPSEQWEEGTGADRFGEQILNAIKPVEWLVNPDAAIVRD